MRQALVLPCCEVSPRVFSVPDPPFRLQGTLLRDKDSAVFVCSSPKRTCDRYKLQLGFRWHFTYSPSRASELGYILMQNYHSFIRIHCSCLYTQRNTTACAHCIAILVLLVIRKSLELQYRYAASFWGSSGTLVYSFIASFHPTLCTH